MVTASPRAQLEVPFTPRPFGRVCLWLFFLTTIVIATYNLLHASSLPTFSLIASIMWLGFTALGAYSTIKNQGGVATLIINELAEFSSCHFVEAHQVDDCPTIIRFGFALFNRRFYRLEIEGSSISTVSWSMGQASAVDGTNANDWSVGLTYYDPNNPRQFKPFRGGDQVVFFFVGSYGPKENTKAFGCQLVAFLKNADINLMPTDDPDEYATDGRPNATSSKR